MGNSACYMMYNIVHHWLWGAERIVVRPDHLHMARHVYVTAKIYFGKEVSIFLLKGWVGVGPSGHMVWYVGFETVSLNSA
jgi:hypothetical protein